MKFSNVFSKIPANVILTLTFVIGILLVGIIFYPLIPILLNYPPDSINNDFQIAVNFFHYTTQYSTLLLAISFIAFPILLILFRGLNKLTQSNSTNININDPATFKSVKYYFSFPYKMLLFILLLPPITLFFGLLLLKQEFLFSIKICGIIFTMTSLIGLITFSLNEYLIKHYLAKINITDKIFEPRISIQNKLLLQFFVLIIFTTIFSFLIIYSQIVQYHGDALYNHYYHNLSNILQSDQEFSSMDELLFTLEKDINFEYDTDSIFIINDDKSIHYSQNTLSSFFIDYAFEYENKHNGRTYDYYGSPIEGTFIRYTLNNEDYLIGVQYFVFDENILYSILPLLTILLVVNISFVLYLSISIKNSISTISESLRQMVYSSKTKNFEISKLPIISSDELSDLTIYFNKLQDMNKSHINEIHSNQNLLMEKERLASLGQLIGGIAHNLKTPIMSISGATEGLKDLITEYDSSVGDPEVTKEDHHEIAQEMISWVSKIKTHTGYMSDVITAVKGQAVNFANDESASFTINELLKRIEILMKHELKHSVTYLNIKCVIDKTTSLTGDINILIQVINNMISNAIQSYQGKTEQTIDLIVTLDNNSDLLISIRDYGSGIKKDVKNKLFKEMVTTKGKNGTGLGLYMSYSTIRASFDGDISVESELHKGTTFTIKLPIKNEIKND